MQISLRLCLTSQALFWKIAAALPGMESMSLTKQEDMVDVNLRSNAGNSSQSQTESGGMRLLNVALTD